MEKTMARDPQTHHSLGVSSGLRRNGSTCTTCWGYGLWAVGETLAMGPMDAGSGLPNQACPECGATNLTPVPNNYNGGK